MIFTAAMAIGGSVLGGLFSQSQADRQAREQREREEAAILAERQSARYLHGAVEASSLLEMNVARESALNAVAEVGRATGANKRESKRALDKADSTLMAQSDGLTAGNSRGRQMVGLLSQGTKLLQEADKEQVSMVNKISSDYEAKQNEINNRYIASYQKMAAILTDEGISSVGSTKGAWVSGSISGASTGASLGGIIK